MQPPQKKYKPFQPPMLEDRRWPSRRITQAPVWCSVDLRDGNQALVNPMNLAEKLEMFRMLCKIGVKEIEVGFPSASETEYEILRTLIQDGHIPDDVTIQVLVQARAHLIEKTFTALDGAKNVIFHFYNSTSALQRKVVFEKDRAGILEIAKTAAEQIRGQSAALERRGTRLRYEYSPESFMGTEPDFAVEICACVLDALGGTAEKPVILNLPSTVESSTPNVFADQVEWFCRNLPKPERAVISLHPHNDRGTSVAAAELGLLAGATRVEGTLFGNGERTGNVDIITLALNLYTQGIDPGLDLQDLKSVQELYERTTKMPVNPRHPYVGELVYTAFSGSHQDAIHKGQNYRKAHHAEVWEVPYLPIDPADIGRDYEPVIRINSQSGKGGAAFIMESAFGYRLPKAMHPVFGQAIKQYCDAVGREIQPDEVMQVFRTQFIDINGPFRLITQRFVDEDAVNGMPQVRFLGEIQKENEAVQPVNGLGNGPIDAFFNALSTVGIQGYRFVDYAEHAISVGSDAKAVSYIQLQSPQGGKLFGVGLSHNINYASIRGVLCAINRHLREAYQ